MAFRPRWSYPVPAVRRLLCLAVLLAGAAAAAADAPVSGGVPADGPRLKFDTVDLNLGDVVRGDDAVATFTYHNTGNAPLKILSAKPG
jgi:hypothetical protein